MCTAWSASRTCRAPRWQSEKTATVGIRISRQARMTRTAISPRFAMSTFTPLIVVVSGGSPGSRGSRGSPGSGSWVRVRGFGFVGSGSGSGSGVHCRGWTVRVAGHQVLMPLGRRTHGTPCQPVHVVELLLCDVALLQGVAQVVLRLREFPERDTYSLRVFARAESAETLGKIRRRGPTGAPDVIAEITIPHGARSRRELEDSILELFAELPRSQLFVMRLPEESENCRRHHETNT